MCKCLDVIHTCCSQITFWVLHALFSLPRKPLDGSPCFLLLPSQTAPLELLLPISSQTIFSLPCLLRLPPPLYTVVNRGAWWTNFYHWAMLQSPLYSLCGSFPPINFLPSDILSAHLSICSLPTGHPPHLPNEQLSYAGVETHCISGSQLTASMAIGTEYTL